ncbi:hypothetical protein Ddye_028317 [Dipteronia dyeriana]|uniref:Uncharacterized protein n=1 Tax=Dipteronia dyeriana TaxID=168575 RepID=A0AAD9TQT1_9ROSI|nr:hypothetical protein Ddye_028317 [Dipteronia dyeriana]
MYPISWVFISMSSSTCDVSTHASEPRKKNLFLQSLYEEEKENGTNSGKNDSRREIQDKDIVEYLDNDVHCWTDFSKVHYHPQSLCKLSGLWMDAQEFNNHGIGKDAFTEGFRGNASAFLCIKDEKPYHCSAVYGAALHSISIPFRMEPVGPSADSDDVSDAMEDNGLIQMLAGQASRIRWLFLMFQCQNLL